MSHFCKKNHDRFITQSRHNDWCNGIIYWIHFMCMNYDWVFINSIYWHEPYRLLKVFLEKIFISSFCCPWRFHWRNTFHVIVGDQQLGQIKDNNFLYHSFPLYHNQEFFFYTLAWYFLVKWRVFFRYFPIKINKSIVAGFVIKACTAHISEELICTFKSFAAVCNHRSSEFSLRVIASVKMTYLFSVSIWDATSYTPIFFVFSLFRHMQNICPALNYL